MIQGVKLGCVLGVSVLMLVTHVGQGFKSNLNDLEALPYFEVVDRIELKSKAGHTVGHPRRPTRQHLLWRYLHVLTMARAKARARVRVRGGLWSLFEGEARACVLLGLCAFCVRCARLQCA